MAFVFNPVVYHKRGGKSTRQRTRFYWADYTDPVDGSRQRHRLNLPSGCGVTQRETAERELRRMLQHRERLAAGLTNRYIEAAKTPIRKLATDYVRFLRRKTIRGKRICRGTSRTQSGWQSGLSGGLESRPWAS